MKWPKTSEFAAIKLPLKNSSAEAANVEENERNFPKNDGENLQRSIKVVHKYYSSRSSSLV